MEKAWALLWVNFYCNKLLSQISKKKKNADIILFKQIKTNYHTYLYMFRNQIDTTVQFSKMIMQIMHDFVFKDHFFYSFQI